MSASTLCPRGPPTHGPPPNLEGSTKEVVPNKISLVDIARQLFGNNEIDVGDFQVFSTHGRGLAECFVAQTGDKCGKSVRDST